MTEGRSNPGGGLKLRPYQEKALAAVDACLSRGKTRLMLVMPTGSGKTVAFAGLLHSLHSRSPGSKSLIVAHREELLDQAARTFANLLPDYEVDVEQGARYAWQGSDIVCASVPTIGPKNRERLGWFTPSHMVIDEAHHVAAVTYQNAIQRFGFFDDPKKILIGVTATNHRMDNKALHGDGATFQEVAFEYSIRDAIRDRWLCPIRGFRVDGGADLSAVRKTAGDFDRSALTKAVDNPKRNSSAIQHWQEVAGERQTIVFCASVEHARGVAEMFQLRGIRAENIDGSMDPDYRRSLISDFRQKSIQVITNVNVLTEGFDAPETSCILMLRPTMSWSLYVQMVGRGTRILDGKDDCIVIDVVDNTGRHDLATLPTLLNLPAGLDLQGRSLEEAAQKLDDIGEKAAVFKIRQPRTFVEIDTVLRDINILADTETPEEVRRSSQNSWIALPSSYYLRCGGDERRGAKLWSDALGIWRCELFVDGRVWKSAEMGNHFEQAIRAADSLIHAHWPTAALLTQENALWKQAPASSRQIDLLIRSGIDSRVAETMTKGQATAALTKIFEHRKRA